MASSMRANYIMLLCALVFNSFTLVASDPPSRSTHNLSIRTTTITVIRVPIHATSFSLEPFLVITNTTTATATIVPSTVTQTLPGVTITTVTSDSLSKSSASGLCFWAEQDILTPCSGLVAASTAKPSTKTSAAIPALHNPLATVKKHVLRLYSAYMNFKVGTVSEKLVSSIRWEQKVADELRCLPNIRGWAVMILIIASIIFPLVQLISFLSHRRRVLAGLDHPGSILHGLYTVWIYGLLAWMTLFIEFILIMYIPL